MPGRGAAVRHEECGGSPPALEASGRVLAVFQGHHHAGGYRQISGIHYCTLRAMVEGPGQDNNAFAVVDALPNGEVRVNGFGKQTSYRWP